MTVTDARVRLLNAQADLREFEIERERGKYLLRTEVLATWQRRFAEARARLLAIPNRIGSRASATASRNEVLVLVQDEIYAALHEIGGDDAEG